MKSLKYDAVYVRVWGNLLEVMLKSNTSRELHWHTLRTEHNVRYK